ncbi:hypothetical protein V1527DRAFT_511537 [Lipomyces starkeyi]
MVDRMGKRVEWVGHLACLHDSAACSGPIGYADDNLSQLVKRRIATTLTAVYSYLAPANVGSVSFSEQLHVAGSLACGQQEDVPVYGWAAGSAYFVDSSRSDVHPPARNGYDQRRYEVHMSCHIGVTHAMCRSPLFHIYPSAAHQRRLLAHVECGGVSVAILQQNARPLSAPNMEKLPRRVTFPGRRIAAPISFESKVSRDRRSLPE